MEKEKNNQPSQFNFLLDQEEVGENQEEGKNSEGNLTIQEETSSAEKEMTSSPTPTIPPTRDTKRNPLKYDPRPDLDERFEDGDLWVYLMQYAQSTHTKFLAGMFHYMRCMGATLKQHRGRYVIRPTLWTVDKPKRNARPTRAARLDYKDFKDRHLSIRADEIRDCLTALEGVNTE